MARKWGVFFHSLHSVLRPGRGGISGPLGSRRRPPLAVYGVLTVVACLGTLVTPAIASLPRSNAIANAPAIAQTVDTAPADAETAPGLEQRAREHYEAGRFSEAAIAFEQAANRYQAAGNLEQAAACQVNQAKALQGLGLYKQAIMVLQTVLQSPAQPTLLLENLAAGEVGLGELRSRLSDLPASSTTVFALRSLGDALQVGGDLGQAQVLLEHSLALAEALSLTEEIAPIYLSLGNLTRTQAVAKVRLNNLTVEAAIAQLQKPLSPIQQALQRRRIEAAEQFMSQTNAALDEYQQAIQAEGSTPLIQVQAQLNTLSLLLDIQQWSAAIAVIPPLYPLLEALPVSQAKVRAHINFADSLMRLAEQPSALTALSPDISPMVQAAQILAAVQQQAQSLNNPQIESYALGSLGELYRRTQQWAEAEALTQQALDRVNAVSATNLPLTVNDTDLAYRWYRQLGQILATQGDREGAIEAYETALTILQDRLRLDVASSNLNYQFSFSQEAQDPVHRELMDLLLQPETPSQKELQRVREVSSSLLEAELTSFSQEPCAVARPQEIDQIVQANEQNVALVYPVVLPDRLEVVVKLPHRSELLHYRELIPQAQLLAQLDELQQALEEDYTFATVKDLSQELYDWLLAPAIAQLQAAQVDTLVFTLDRYLQPIPMAALYDGQDYLIKRYAIAEFLGLSVERSSTQLQQSDLKIMAAGLSTIPPLLPPSVRDIFSPLTFVEQELAALNGLNQQGIRVETLQDEQFTLANFNRQLNADNFPIVHLATHGQFSVDPDRTFLMTSGEFGNALVAVNELAALFRVRGQIRLDTIELLVLNACETAAGDDLATLGIAGTAVRAGANSAIASLWTLDDAPSVAFTQTLYDQLRQPSMSKAKALQAAQLALLANPLYQHPRYWSPYILAGNWLPLTTSRSASSVETSRSN